MESLSTLITSYPQKIICPSLKTISSTILCIGAFSSLLLLRYSPLVLWFAANAIIFLVYKLSMSHHLNHLDPQTDELVRPMLIASFPSERWHDYHASAPDESELIEKEEMCVDSFREEEDEEVMKDKGFDDTWRTIVMQCSTAQEKRKPLLEKSNSWERSTRRPRRADQLHKPELNKLYTYKNGREEQTGHNQQVVKEARTKDTGWRTRDVLAVAHDDDLFIRIENFIKKQHDHLRLQRQEEYRRFIESF